MNSVLSQVIPQLEAERDILQATYDRLSAAAEEARRACVPVQQVLDKIKDALSSLGRAQQWNAEEVPL